MDSATYTINPPAMVSLDGRSAGERLTHNRLLLQEFGRTTFELYESINSESSRASEWRMAN